MANGIILVNKPRGISSNTVVNIVKRVIGAKKAGHLGTLDVAGEGLLPITINKATKLFDYFLNKDKEYISVFKFGETTDTLDLEGQITASDDKIISQSLVKSVLYKFIGKQNQMPPAYSAKKINGQKAYDLARRGEEPLLRPKEIEIYDLSLLRQLEQNTFEFKVHCSSGTYIRSLCRDIATSLSTYGVMLSILRTKCGIFELKDAQSLEEIKQGKFNLLPPDLLFDYPSLHLDEKQAALLQNGVQMKTQLPSGQYKAYFNQEFLGNVKVENNIMQFSLRLC